VGAARTDDRSWAIDLGRWRWPTGRALDFALALLLGLLTVQTRRPHKLRLPYAWDSLLYIRALEHFDPTIHQPQPPGYLLYVATARLLLLWVEGALHVISPLHKNSGGCTRTEDARAVAYVGDGSVSVGCWGIAGGRGDSGSVTMPGFIASRTVIISRHDASFNCGGTWRTAIPCVPRGKL